MKTLRNLIIIVLPLTLFTLSTISAQEQKLDKIPSPIGGIEGIAKKVVYPADAKNSKIQGKVLVAAYIDEIGNVEKTEIERGVDKQLDNAAILAIKDTKFTPGELNGKKVKAKVTIPVLFKLCDDK